MKGWVLAAAAAAALLGARADAQVIIETRSESPRSGFLHLKMGSYTPRIDSEEALGDATPYATTFGGGMLMPELEIGRYFYQGIGSAGLSFSAAYGEKFAGIIPAGSTVADRSAGVTYLRVIPMQLSLTYAFDWAALKYGIPVVPFGRAGLRAVGWWSGDSLDEPAPTGMKGNGMRYGYGLSAGVKLMLDVLEPRLARDFDTEVGVNHSYLFAEYTYANVNNFGRAGFDLGSRQWMFGLALDY